MKAGFSLGDEFHTFSPIWRVRHQPRFDGGSTHHTLLRTLPAVRVTENKVNVLAERLPKQIAICMGLLDVGTSVLVHVDVKISENVNDILFTRRQLH